MSRVLQGHNLKPILFIIFINDVAESFTKSHALIFADDTKITTKCPYELQNDLLRLHDWALENGMVFIADKTKPIRFSLKKPVKVQLILVFEDEDVSFTFEPVKYLGIFFVSTLSWTPHIEKQILDAYGRFINLKRSLLKLIS